MQFCQPPFQPTGCTNYGQPCGFSTPIPDQNIGYPDIIGEGNIVSAISPDGSTQLLFFPTLQWPQRRTFPPNPYVGNLHNQFINTSGAWFVRNIFNSIPLTLPQPQQDCFSLQYPRATASYSRLDLLLPGLPLKFHNDTCTSTSDLHYFIPLQQSHCIRSHVTCTAAHPADVQATCPVPNTTSCDYEATCTKPCNCTPAKPCNCDVKDKEEKQNIKCTCRIKKSDSKMSLDSTRSHQRRRNKKPRRHKSKKSSHKCECKERPGSDKCVTTYTDQGNGSAPDKGQETQTPCSNSVPVIKVGKGACNRMRHRAETWSSKPCTSKQAKSQSTVSSEQYSYISDSRTSCSCTSGTELDL